MSAYSDLKQISIAYAIQAMTDLVLDRGTLNKVLLVPIRLSANDFSKEEHENFGAEFTIVVYRPNNYCFVGMIEGSPYELKEGADVHYETYHDSCWRDGIDRMIRAKANEIYKKIEEAGSEEEASVFNSFGISSPKVVEGNIIMDESDNRNRKASFTEKLREW